MRAARPIAGLTVGARLTVCGIAAADLTLCLAYARGLDSRTSTPAFHPARALGGAVVPAHPMWAWAMVYGLLFVAIAAGYLTGRLRPLGVALVAAAGVHAFYGATFVLAAVDSPVVSYGGGVTYLVLGLTCIGVAMSCADVYGRERVRTSDRPS